MTGKKIADDLAYASAIARAGAQSPLLGGPIGLLWGLLLAITFFVQWLILGGALDIAPQNLFYLWAGFVITGGLGQWVIGKKITSKPGVNSMANQVEGHVWAMFKILMGTIFVGILLNLWLNDGSPQLFDFLVIAGFAGQGIAYGVVARVSAQRWAFWASFAGFLAACLCFTVFGHVSLHLIAAIAAIPTLVVPSLVSMRNERANG